MLPFHDGPVIRKNIIVKIMLASCSAKISYCENFRIYGTYVYVVISMKSQNFILLHLRMKTNSWIFHGWYFHECWMMFVWQKFSIWNFDSIYRHLWIMYEIPMKTLHMFMVVIMLNAINDPSCSKYTLILMITSSTVCI